MTISYKGDVSNRGMYSCLPASDGPFRILKAKCLLVGSFKPKQRECAKTRLLDDISLALKAQRTSEGPARCGFWRQGGKAASRESRAQFQR